MILCVVLTSSLCVYLWYLIVCVPGFLLVVGMLCCLRFALMFCADGFNSVVLLFMLSVCCFTLFRSSWWFRLDSCGLGSCLLCTFVVFVLGVGDCVVSFRFACLWVVCRLMFWFVVLVMDIAGCGCPLCFCCWFGWFAYLVGLCVAGFDSTLRVLCVV